MGGLRRLGLCCIVVLVLTAGFRLTWIGAFSLLVVRLDCWVVCDLVGLGFILGVGWMNECWVWF